MDEPKLFVDENQLPPVRVLREGFSAYRFIRTLLDPETAGTANAVLGVMTVPAGQLEPMQPHAHFEYDESEYVVSGEGYPVKGRTYREIATDLTDVKKIGGVASNQIAEGE